MPRRRAVLRAACGGTAVLAPGCLDEAGTGTNPTVTTLNDDSALALTSTAFDDGGAIPVEYTFEGADRSPPLSISGVPDDAASLVLVVDDADASNQPFTHWVLWNVPPGTTEIPAGIRQSRRVSGLDGAKQGTNSFGELGYRGPRPPEGDEPHTYRFTLYAVEQSLNVQAGAQRGQVVEGLQNNLVATARLSGEFER